MTKAYTVDGAWKASEVAPDVDAFLIDEEIQYRDIPSGETLTVFVGFITDGASIPRSLYSVIGNPLRKGFRRASSIHDIAFITGKWDSGMPLTLKDAGRLFYDVLILDGVKPWRAKVMRWGVTSFVAKKIWNRYKKKRETDLFNFLADNGLTRFNMCNSLCESFGI